MDIPDADIMIIESAERFGLSSLHQLRGRVGRGNRQAYCLLFTSNNLAANTQRLKYLETVHSGLKLAELDLKLRGPGNILGISQHGFFNLKLASLSDNQLLNQTKKAASDSVNQLNSNLKAILKQRTIQPIALN